MNVLIYCSIWCDEHVLIASEYCAGRSNSSMWRFVQQDTINTVCERAFPESAELEAQLKLSYHFLHPLAALIVPEILNFFTAKVMYTFLYPFPWMFFTNTLYVKRNLFFCFACIKMISV